MKTKITTLVFAFASCFSVIAANSEYSYGHGALQVFGGDGFKEAPTWVKIWISFLLSTFLIGFYFALKHPIARWTSGGFIVSMTSGHTVFSLLSLPFLGGSIAIMHLVCWMPALIFLLIKRPFLDLDKPKGFRIWSGVITGVILFSFVFDIRDALLYIHHFSSSV